MLTLKNTNLNNSREIALYILVSAINNDYKLYEQLNLFEKTVKNIDNRDYKFVEELCNGTLKNLIKIDYCLEFLVKKDFKKLPENILNILRLCIYQILFMPDIPFSASINESVKLAKKYGHPGTVKLTNGVLRNFARKLNEIQDSIEQLNLIKKLSIKYSIPDWIIKYWSESFSDSELIKLTESMSFKAELFLRINTLKISVKDFLEKINVPYERTEINELIKLTAKVSISDIYGYNEGFFYIQDLGAAKVSDVLNPKEHDFIIDMCAFPGGKTTHISSLMKNTGNILVIDSNKNREEKFIENIKKLDARNISVRIQSATDSIYDIPLADKILVDPPCSGLGVIRRKIEIKYRRSFDDIKRLSDLQYEILLNASRYIKLNGNIIYSTCTISKYENEDVINKFLENNKQFKKDIEFINLYPFRNNTDGFFIASLKRIN